MFSCKGSLYLGRVSKSGTVTVTARLCQNFRSEHDQAYPQLPDDLRVDDPSDSDENVFFKDSGPFSIDEFLPNIPQRVWYLFFSTPAEHSVRYHKFANSATYSRSKMLLGLIDHRHGRNCTFGRHLDNFSTSRCVVAPDSVFYFWGDDMFFGNADILDELVARRFVDDGRKYKYDVVGFSLPGSDDWSKEELFAEEEQYDPYWFCRRFQRMWIDRQMMVVVSRDGIDVYAFDPGLHLASEDARYRAQQRSNMHQRVQRFQASPDPCSRESGTNIFELLIRGVGVVF